MRTLATNFGTEKVAPGVVRVKSRGLGDSIAKITEATGIKAVVHKISEAVGRDCGCQNRQNKLNERFPYNQNNI